MGESVVESKRTMHVFIDTNILLNFFHFTSDELDALTEVFATREQGSASVHLTQQVKDEFIRNRDNKIKSALKRFREANLVPQLPSFMKAYEEFGRIRHLASELKLASKGMLAKADKDIRERELLADRLISEIFKSSDIRMISDEVFSEATRRMALGNPPGKDGSLGDAVNWISLLQSIPDDEDVHLISEDGDFYSCLDEDAPSAFLAEEWSEKKKGTLFVYRTLSGFLKEHFDGVAFAFDKRKEALIEGLAESKSFASTHSLIEKLEGFSYYSAAEVSRILAAAVSNSQVHLIDTDRDVSDFLNRVAVPHKESIDDEDQLKILANVIQDQADRDQDGD